MPLLVVLMISVFLLICNNSSLTRTTLYLFISINASLVLATKKKKKKFHDFLVHGIRLVVGNSGQWQCIYAIVFASVLGCEIGRAHV